MDTKPQNETRPTHERICATEHIPEGQRKFMLGLSLLDVFVLKEIAACEKKGVVRYQLLKTVEAKVGKTMFSTAKFYRILEKFSEEGLVETLETKRTSNSAYELTEKGRELLFTLHKFIAISNVTVFSLIQPKLKDLFQLVANTAFRDEQQRKAMIKLAEHLTATGKFPPQTKKVFQQGLFIDWTGKRQEDLVAFLTNICEHTHIMVPEAKLEETEEWRDEELGITLYSHGRIREVDDEYDFIVVVDAASLPPQDRIPFLQEAVRTLRPGGVIVITELEALPTTPDGGHHLTIEFLLAMSPIPLVHLATMDESEFRKWAEALDLEDLTFGNFHGLLVATGLKPQK